MHFTSSQSVRKVLRTSAFAGMMVSHTARHWFAQSEDPSLLERPPPRRRSCFDRGQRSTFETWRLLSRYNFFARCASACSLIPNIFVEADQVPGAGFNADETEAITCSFNCKFVTFWLFFATLMDTYAYYRRAPDPLLETLCDITDPDCLQSTDSEDEGTVKDCCENWST